MSEKERTGDEPGEELTDEQLQQASGGGPSWIWDPDGWDSEPAPSDPNAPLSTGYQIPD